MSHDALWEDDRPRLIRRGLSDRQKARLAQLEGLHRPTPFARGELAAMRLCSGDDSEWARIAALEVRWEFVE
jgi:hypothetical protein